MKNPWLLGLFGGLFLFGGAQIRSFERSAAADVRRKLQGEAATVKVRIRPAGLSGALASATIEAAHFSTDGLPLFTEPERSTRGVVHELRLSLSDFTLRGLRIERLSAKIPDCRFDYSLAFRRRQIRLSRSGVGFGSVEILDKDLEAFILKKYREIKRVTVRVANGRAHVEGYGEFVVFNTNFSVDARLESPEGDKLYLADAAITLDGNPADEAARNALLSTLNPVVDLNRDLHLFGAIHVDRLDLRDGRVLASGATRIPEHPKL